MADYGVHADMHNNAKRLSQRENIALSWRANVGPPANEKWL